MTLHRHPLSTVPGRRRPQRQPSSERRQRHRRTGPRTAGPLARRWWQRERLIYAVPSRRSIGVRVYSCALLGFMVAEATSRMLLRHRDIGIDTTVLLATATLVIAHVVDQVLQHRMLRHHSYGWYRRRFPTQVRPDGRIVCRHCGDRRTHQEALPHRNDYPAQDDHAGAR